MFDRETLLKTFGAPPDLIEKSRRTIEHFLYFGSNAYDEYVMFEGISHYAGTVPYERICLQ